MYTEEINTGVFDNDATIVINLPADKWELIKKQSAWAKVESMINEAQKSEDIKNTLMNEKHRKSYCIKYADIPLMQDAIRRIDDLHKRIMISLALPTFSLLVSLTALVLALVKK